MRTKSRDLVDFTKIEAAKHIVLKCDADSFTNASALYSYILTEHKKVSLVCETPLAEKFSFLPWFEKVRQKVPSSADCIINVDSDVLSLYDFFQKKGVKINKKMATALYGALLLRYDLFRSSECDGIVFATASQLIELNAAHKECIENLHYCQPLASFRLQSILYKNMLLCENASVALLPVSEEDLKESGASIEDAYVIMNEVLKLAHVQEVRLVQEDEKSKILKSIVRK